MTRTTGLLLSGDVPGAFRTNPLDASVLVLGVPFIVALWVANRAGRWALRLSATRRERLLLWVAVGVGVAWNWIYVLSSGV
jgi:hypothetical protein